MNTKLNLDAIDTEGLMQGIDMDAVRAVRAATARSLTAAGGIRTREEILAHGGIEACNSFTRIYLAIFGQCSWDDTPAVPPEIMPTVVVTPRE